MKPIEQRTAGKGEKVRKAVAEMLSSEEQGREPEREDAPGTLSERQPVPASGGSPAEVAAHARLAEIQTHVSELVEDPELEQNAAVPEPRH